MRTMGSRPINLCMDRKRQRRKSCSDGYPNAEHVDMARGRVKQVSAQFAQLTNEDFLQIKEGYGEARFDILVKLLPEMRRQRDYPRVGPCFRLHLQRYATQEVGVIVVRRDVVKAPIVIVAAK